MYTCRLACACAGLEDRRVALQSVTMPCIACNGGGEYTLQQGGWHGEQGSPWASPSPTTLANRVRRLCCSTRWWKWRGSVITAATVIHHDLQPPGDFEIRLCVADGPSSDLSIKTETLPLPGMHARTWLLVVRRTTRTVAGAQSSSKVTCDL